MNVQTKETSQVVQAITLAISKIVHETNAQVEIVKTASLEAYINGEHHALAMISNGDILTWTDNGIHLCESRVVDTECSVA
jgi:hypothetical protein